MARDFKLDEDKMLEVSTEHLGHFQERKAEFIAEDADFADPFETDWEDSITDSENYEDAETRSDQGTVETAQVQEFIAQGKVIYGEMKYFVKKAYPSDNAVDTGKRNKFGFNDYDEKSATQKGMIRFLAKLYKVSNSATHKPDLLAVNCTQPKIDSIKTIHDNLRAQNKKQNVFLSKESEATILRDAQYNSTWVFDKKVNACAHVIYRTKPEVLKLFLFPVKAGVDAFNLLGTVTAAAGGAPIENAELEIIEEGIVVQTDDEGNYGFVLPDNTYTLTCKKAGFVLQTFTITIAGGVAVTQNVAMVAE